MAEGSEVMAPVVPARLIRYIHPNPENIAKSDVARTFAFRRRFGTHIEKK